MASAITTELNEHLSETLSTHNKTLLKDRVQRCGLLYCRNDRVGLL